MDARLHQGDAEGVAGGETFVHVLPSEMGMRAEVLDEIGWYG